MKKYLIYWSIIMLLLAAIFTWWWNQPAKYIERVTTLSVVVEETLVSQTVDSTKVYLLKAGRSYVKKVIDGCELHGGAFASADQTSAVRFRDDAAFKTNGFFKSNNIGCLIKGNKEKEGWEFFVKDDLLYFQITH